MNCSIIREFETATETHVLIGSMERQYWKADLRRQKENCKAKERKAKNEHKRSLGSVRQCDNKQLEVFSKVSYLNFPEPDLIYYTKLPNKPHLRVKRLLKE